MCRGGGKQCILDPPTLEDVQKSLGPDMSPRKYQKAFDIAYRSYKEGLHFRRGESCEFGHTDYASATDETAGSCREAIVNDNCVDKPPPFVCVCVSPSVAFRARDEIGDENRFYLVYGAVICGVVAMIMLTGQAVYCVKKYASRNWFFRANALSRVHRRDDEGQVQTAPLVNKASGWKVRRSSVASTEARDLGELWRCAMSCTFCVAIIGAPTMAVVGWVRPDYGYFTGCGALLEFTGDPGAALVTTF
jgi:hypothetical protein